MTTANVVNIGDFAVKRKRRSSELIPGECTHLKMTMDDDGYHIRCDDCKVQLSAFWVLERMLATYQRSVDSLRYEKKHLADEKAKNISLLAAKKVERAWRSKSMVPTCPHCHEAIFPTDGLGGGSVNKALALRRRSVEIAGKTPKPIIIVDL